MTASKEVFFAELLKCQLLCKPCHIIKTKKELAKPIIHGTRAGGDRCKCCECKEAKNSYLKEWRRRNKK